MKISREKHRRRRQAGPPQPPPNYFARGVQLRLLVLVFSFMLVVVLMGEARKPENWRWMWAGQGEAALTPAEIADEEIDTRLRVGERAPAPTAGPIVTGQAEPREPAEPFELNAADGALHRALLDGWTQQLAELDGDGRAALYRSLKVVRDDAALDDAATAALAAVLARLNSGWDRYFEEAFLAAAGRQSGLSDEQRKVWLDSLDEMQRRWNNQWRPALEYLVDVGLLPEKHRTALDELQELCDQIELRTVRDDTVARNVERYAWFRLLEKLQTADADQLQAASTGRVGYVQLYKTPQDYRGRLVTVRGSARLAYHVQAPSNDYGIDGYYIFWLKPAGGPDSPIVVYTLRLPAGFPQVKDRDLDKATTELNEDVEFTGYFFKRWAYRAKDGTRLAPLVLADAPTWSPPVFAVDQSAPPSAAWIVVAIGGAMALGIVVAVAAYFRSNWVSVSRYHGARGISAGSLAGADRGDVGQALSRLAAHTRDDAGEQAEQNQ